MKTVHENDHGMLMTDEGHPFGNLIYFEERGVYDPNYGKVDIDPALVETHNKLLDEALVKGLDENCEVGQGGFFYLSQAGDTRRVHTFGGLTVADAVVKGKKITFARKGKTFEGRVEKDADSFRFERVA